MRFLENGKLEQDESLIYEYRKAFYEIFIERTKSTNAAGSHVKRITEEVVERVYNLKDDKFIRFLKFLDLSSPFVHLPLTSLLNLRQFQTLDEIYILLIILQSRML